MRTPIFSSLLLALASFASADLPKCSGDNCFNAVNAKGKGVEASAFCSAFLGQATTISSVATVYATAATTHIIPDAQATADVTITVTEYATQDHDESYTTVETVQGVFTERQDYTVHVTSVETVTASVGEQAVETAGAVVTDAMTDTITVTENYDVTATEYITDVPATSIVTVEASTTQLATTTGTSTHFLQRRQATGAFAIHVSDKCPAATARGVVRDQAARLSSACSCIIAAPTSTSTHFDTVTATTTTNYHTEGPLATITTTILGTASVVEVVTNTRISTFTDVFSEIQTEVVTDLTTIVATDFFTTTETFVTTLIVTETSTAIETATDLVSATETRTVDTLVITLPATTTYLETVTTFTAPVTVTVGAEELVMVQVYCGKKARGNPSPELQSSVVRVDENVYTARECHQRCQDVTACQGASHLKSAKTCVLYSVTLTGGNFAHEDKKTHWGWSKVCPRRVNAGPEVEEEV